MAEHSLDQLFGVALLAQDRGPILRMPVERRVDFVVEVVEERGCRPQLLVFAKRACIGRHGSFDRQRMPSQRLALRVGGQRCPGALACDVHAAPSVLVRRTAEGRRAAVRHRRVP